MAKPKGKILLVEDDKNLGIIIKDFLEMSDYMVILKENGQEGLNEFRKGSYDLVLLDIMLPLVDGFTVAEEIRKYDCEVPLMFMTAKSMKEDKLKGFRLGADDYLTKPFSTEELKLRINAILRRTRYKNNAPVKTTPYTIGQYTFDYGNHLLTSSESEKRLTKREAELLNLLCINMNNTLRREIALKTIWGEDDYFMGRSMDVYITKLRKLLGNDPRIAITNIHNTGFKLEVKEI
ncbi:MAG TPA: response regulator transcription factor [Bacteroidales bacterium]|nr:response regulator transcription factor [Bacteroidales bacterium]